MRYNGSNQDCDMDVLLRHVSLLKSKTSFVMIVEATFIPRVNITAVFTDMSRDKSVLLAEDLLTPNGYVTIVTTGIF